MTKYIADSNVFLRFFLQDNKNQLSQVNNFFDKAARGEVEIIVLSETIPEIEYVLAKVYKEERSTISEWLLSLAKTPYFKIEKRETWIRAILIYKETRVDLIDIYLFVRKIESGVKILSFDKDFRKLEKKYG